MPGRDRQVVVNGLALHLREWGSAAQPLVVLVHGGSAHAGWWDYLAAALEHRFHVVAVDLRGHGDSAWAVPPAYRLSDHVADLEGLATTLAWPQFHLIGHSLGGMIAAAFATDHPARLRSLTIVDTGLRMSESGVRYMRRLRYFPRTEHADRETAVRRFVLLPKQTNAGGEILAEIAAQSLRPTGEGSWTLKFDRETLAHFEPVDLLPPLSELALPILLVRGELSAVLGRDRQTAMAAALQNAQCAEVANAHHHVMLDNPAAFARAVGNFLDRVA